MDKLNDCCMALLRQIVTEPGNLEGAHYSVIAACDWVDWSGFWPILDRGLYMVGLTEASRAEWEDDWVFVDFIDNEIVRATDIDAEQCGNDAVMERDDLPCGIKVREAPDNEDYD